MTKEINRPLFSAPKRNSPFKEFSYSVRQGLHWAEQDEGGRALASGVINSPPLRILISVPKLGKQIFDTSSPNTNMAKALFIRAQLIQNLLHLHKNNIYAHELTNMLHFIRISFVLKVGGHEI